VHRQPDAAHDGDWSAEFQTRRQRAWRKARWAFAVLAITLPLALYDMRFFFVAFVGGFGAILWLVYVATRHYLCPACGKMPMTSGAAFGTDGISYRRSVDLDPEFCSSCGVRLKPEPELKRLFF
jgi:hypothetical protein